MKLSEGAALARLATTDHGVLATVDVERGVHAVPAVFAVADGHLGVPIDRVKPKTSVRLRRERNLDADPRATFVVDHWDRDDWLQLWWVRLDLVRVTDAHRAEHLAACLVDRYPQYRAAGPDGLADVIVFRIDDVVGWSAG